MAKARTDKNNAQSAIEPSVQPADIEAALLRQMDALVNIRSVSTLTTLSTSEINRRIASGKFPRPIPIGEKRKAWRISHIQSWINAQMSPATPAA